MPAAVDLTGQTFDRLTVIGRAGRKWNLRMWLCRCACGKEIQASTGALRHGNARSCGCTRGKPRNGIRSQRSYGRTHKTWQSMNERCHNPNHAKYSRYGGAGILVCDRWHDFENFLADMGERPEGKTIDRFPNRNGNYEPGNCRWATPQEQTTNSKTARLTYDLVQEIWGRHEYGESAKSIANRIGVSQRTIYNVLDGTTWKGSASGYV